jgi:hypothetical protein
LQGTHIVTFLQFYIQYPDTIPYFLQFHYF